MAFGVLELLFGLATLLTVLYYYLTLNYNFWKDQGVPGPKPLPVFGTIKNILLGKLSHGAYLRRIYEEYPNEPMVGIYTRRDPVLVLSDMELIKTILIKDFNTFPDRGMDFHEGHEPLGPHLFNLEPKRWRQMRPKLSPAYTSGKLRDMFYLIRGCADQLDEHLQKFNGQVVDMREVAAKFTIDVIGVCAFGVQANALKDEDSLFREMGRRIFFTDLKAFLRLRLRFFALPLFHLIGGWLVDHEVQNFFINLMRDTMVYRSKNNIVRNDFVDQLMELKKIPSKAGDVELTDSLMAAQLFVFFLAGFETSSSTISNCLLELAINQKIQDRLRDEICEQLEKTNGEITYEGIKNMEYLDRVVKETLRKYPPVDTIMRKAVKGYTFPDTKVSIPEGTKVWIPIFGIQRDPKYFPNPEIFDPERFTEDAVKSRPQMAWLAFGDGPRNCIGARFGSMQSKVGLVKILRKFTVEVCEKTDVEYKINPRTFLLAPLNGVFLKIAQVSNE